jgi:hypothetical protein
MRNRNQVGLRLTDSDGHDRDGLWKQASLKSQPFDKASASPNAQANRQIAAKTPHVSGIMESGRPGTFGTGHPPNAPLTTRYKHNRPSHTLCGTFALCMACRGCCEMTLGRHEPRGRDPALLGWVADLGLFDRDG